MPWEAPRTARWPATSPGHSPAHTRLDDAAFVAATSAQRHSGLGTVRWPESHHVTGVGAVAPHQEPPPAYLHEPGVAHSQESHRRTMLSVYPEVLRVTGYESRA